MSTTTSPLSLTLLVRPVLQSGTFPVTARFTNVSAGPVRMLRMFDPLPVFFTTSLQRLSGEDVDVAGAGKADFPEEELTPTEVGVGESFDAEVDLKPWIRAPLVSGTYSLTMTYHNSYGDGCFRGPLTSAPINVEVRSTL